MKITVNQFIIGLVLIGILAFFISDYQEFQHGTGHFECNTCFDGEEYYQCDCEEGIEHSLWAFSWIPVMFSWGFLGIRYGDD